jgi:hypothetical protein
MGSMLMYELLAAERNVLDRRERENARWLAVLEADRRQLAGAAPQAGRPRRSRRVLAKALGIFAPGRAR